MAEVPKPNTRSEVKVATSQNFNRNSEKVRGFVTACKLYLRIRMRGTMVEEKAQWVFTYVQGEIGDILEIKHSKEFGG